MEKKDLIGKKFNKLTIVEHIENGYYLCKCDCGNIKKIRIDHVLNGATKSCGCLQKENCSKLGKTTGPINSKKNAKQKSLSNTKLYRIWYGIKNRCNNKKHYKYKWYGARGIKVCDKWQSNFLSFYNWAINNGFDENKKWQDCTIDRINNNGNYEPNNCRWISLKEQQRNKRNNVNITFMGETHCIAEWSKLLRINKKNIKEVLNF